MFSTQPSATASYVEISAYTFAIVSAWFSSESVF